MTLSNGRTRVKIEWQSINNWWYLKSESTVSGGRKRRSKRVIESNDELNKTIKRYKSRGFKEVV